MITEILIPFTVRSAAKLPSNADATPTAVVFVDGVPVADVPTIVPSVGTGNYTSTLLIDVVAGQSLRFEFDADVSGARWFESALVIIAPENYYQLRVTAEGYVENSVVPVTPADLTAAKDAILARGNLAWITATGFATPADVAAARDAVLDRGNSAWITSTFAAADVWSYFVVATGDAAVDRIAAETATQLATSHGAGSWEGGVGASGGGPVPLTVTVTSGADPLAGVVVYILDSAGDPLDKWLPTNANGQCVFGLAAGDYQIAIGTLSGYTTPAPVPKTLLAATAATETIALTAQTTDPPGAAGLCVIDDYILNASEQPVVGAEVVAQASTAAVLLNPGVVTQVKSKAITGADGRFTLQLVRADAMSAGSYYTIEIKRDAKSIFRTISGPIPNAVSATLNDIEAGA